MDRTRVELGSTATINWLIEDSGAGVTGAAARTSISLQRMSDGHMYDFDDDSWSAAPTLSYTTLSENSDMQGVYYYELDTSTLSGEDVVLAHLSCASSPADTHAVELEVARSEDYKAFGTVSHDYDSGITYMAAVLVDDDSGLVVTADRAVFRIVKANDGSVLLDDEQVDADVDGVFSHSQGSLGLEAHTAYLLVVSVELDTQSYYNAHPFTVL